MARLAVTGEPTLNPVRNGSGRWENLRIRWVAEVRAAENLATSLRSAAVVLAAMNNGQAAGDALRRAEAVLTEGLGSPAAAPLDQEAIAEAWGKITGKDPTDPKTQDEIIEAIAEMRRRRLEKEGKMAAARATTKVGQPAKKARNRR